jgi:restriction system protein
MPDLPAMMYATVKALKEIGSSATIQELDEKVVELEGLTEAEQAIQMPNDARLKVNYFLAWARTYLKRGGAITNSSRAVWSLTDVGEKVASVEEARRIHEQVRAEERERAAEKRKLAKEKELDETRRPPSQIDLPINEDDDAPSWELNLLNVLGSVSPDGFERLSQRLLREAGFTKVEVRGKVGDGGIDGVGVLRVNLVSFQVYFQCKRWKGSVGAREIRDFRGALQGRADKGLFITTGDFTSQAFDEATRDGAIAIDLIDGQRLCELLKQFELGVKTELVEKITIDQNWLNSV